MSVNAGDTAWVLGSAGLVLFMTPGLALFYGGMVRSKNVLGIMIQNFAAIAVVGVVWALIGYTLAFGPDVGGGLLGDLEIRRPRRQPHAASRDALEHPALRLRRVPDDVRDHHRRVADRSRCRSPVLQGFSRPRGPVDHPCLRARRALGFLTGRMARQARRARLRRRERRGNRLRRLGSCPRSGARQAAGLATRGHGAAFTAADRDGRRNPLVPWFGFNAGSASLPMALRLRP